MSFLLLLTISSGVLACSAIQFEFTNNIPGPIWVGILGNPGHANLEGGGFNLNQGQTITINAADNWAGRFWARTWCNADGNNHCATGDCGFKLQCNGAAGEPPATLVEITLRGNSGGNQDFYDISLVDGFNVRASIQPFGGTGDCRRAGCDNDLNPNCPSDLRVNYRGFIVACKSSCLKYNTDQFCCRGQFNSPSACNPNTWNVNSAGYFKAGCPQAYSYAYDDRSSTFTCFGATRYRIVFA